MTFTEDRYSEKSVLITVSAKVNKRVDNLDKPLSHILGIDYEELFS